MSHPLKTIVISGGTGLVGQAILRHLPGSVERCIILTRKAQMDGQQNGVVRYSVWNPEQGEIDDAVLADADAIINLAGANIAQRWTPKAKAMILSSRVDSTRTLRHALERHPNIRCMVSASAIGFYPDRPNVQDETAQGDDSFVSRVVQQWEDEWTCIAPDVARTVGLRIGLVLAREEGFYRKLEPVFRLGLGAPLGTGRQLVSWIHVDDLARLFIVAATDPEMQGIYNAVSPQTLSNRAFTKEMAAAMKRPAITFLGVPAFLLRWAMGEMATIALRSAGASAEKLLASGFSFEFPTVLAAVKNLRKQA